MPGWYGFSNVKWLANIHVQDEGYLGRFQARWYRTLRGETIDGEVKWQETAISRMRVKSVIARVTTNGAVLDPDDFDDLAAYLSGQITNPVIGAQIEARCSVIHTTECNVLDLVHLRLALDGVLPGVETRCDAALAPPSP